MSAKELSNDLSEFATLLEKSNLIRDVKGIYEISSRLFYLTGNSWQYECIDLEFNPFEGSIGGCMPNTIKLVEVYFSLGIHEEQSIQGSHVIDPIKKLEFNIVLKGWDEKANNYYASWHLDKHDSGGEIPKFIHPEYHLTFGGNRMESKVGNDTGSALVIPTPRIVYPPMDVILGVDFVLQNYFPFEKISSVIQNPTYQEIVRKSQFRLWYPYYLSIASRWNNFAPLTFDNNFRYERLNPHII